MGGTARMLVAESLFPVMALVTTAFLTRHLGPQGYGLLTLTLTAIIWIESAIMSFFSKATIKLVGEADDWRPLGSNIIRLTALSGTAAMAGVWALAVPLSVLLREPDLTRYLWVGAVDIPILCTALAYRSVLIGTAQYHAGAVGRAGRWIARLCLVILLLESGFSIMGGLLGVIGSSFVELALYRWYLGPGMLLNRIRTAMPIRRYGTALFVSSVCLIAYSGMDLFMLKILGGTATQAGIYGAAQSLSLLPALFAWTFSAILLGTLSRLLAEQEQGRAKELARDSMRVTLWLLPVAAIVAGSASDIVQTVFGSAFGSAASLLSLLVFGATANVMLVVGLTIMTAAGVPVKTVHLTAPLVLLAFGGHLLLIPRMGEQGAALVTLGVSFLGASAAIVGVHGLWNVSPPGATLLRSVAVSLIAGVISMVWPVHGFPVFAKLIGLGVFSLMVYWMLGEFRHGELAMVRGWLNGKTEPVHVG